MISCLRGLRRVDYNGGILTEGDLVISEVAPRNAQAAPLAKGRSEAK